MPDRGSAPQPDDDMLDVVQIEVYAPIVSLRNPIYAGVQVGLPCPPPATVGGMLAAAAGGWQHVDPATRFAMAFHAAGQGTDLETYHPLDAAGRYKIPQPMDREFLAEVTLTVWVDRDPDLWEQRMRQPRWPLRLGRSQDLATARTHRVRLRAGAGRQGRAVVPAGASGAGGLLRLPTAVSLDRARTRWDSYRYHPRSTDTVPHADTTTSSWATDDGQAVMFLPPTHPSHAVTPP
jgi:CRISPR-associated Cas5-like protein